MRKLLTFLSLFLFVGAAFAATVEYKDENITIQLYDTPCVSEKIKALAGGQLPPGVNAAKIGLKDRQIEACWLFDVDHIDIVDEEGTQITDISPAIFKVVQTI